MISIQLFASPVEEYRVTMIKRIVTAVLMIALPWLGGHTLAALRQPQVFGISDQFPRRQIHSSHVRKHRLA